MGSAGRLGPHFPGFGLTGGKNRSPRLRLRPVCLVGVLSIANPRNGRVEERDGSVEPRVRGVGLCHGDSPGSKLLLLPIFRLVGAGCGGGRLPNPDVLLACDIASPVPLVRLLKPILPDELPTRLLLRS